MCIEWNDDWLIKDIYEHQNSNSMNEYRGFKVGDKVEVIDPCSSSKNKKGDIGIIKEMQIGSLMEYGKCVVILVVPEGASDVARWEHFSAIKKIPKYSAGDVVRRMGVISVVVKYEETPPYYLVDGADGKDSNWSLMSELTDFDGFRVGDTVWTVKRGKGKIASKHITKGGHESWKKPFWVHFDDGHETTPKKENLIPTEAKYKEALNKTGYAFKIDVAFVEKYKPKPNSLIETRCSALRAEVDKIEKTKQAMDLIHSAAKMWANAFWRTTDQIKFPSGGVVFDTPICRAEAITPLPLGKLKWYTDNVVCGVEESLYSQLVVTEKGVCKYKSKFGMGELVSYAGCIRAVVDKIHYKDGKFTYDLRTNSCPEGLPEDSLSAVVAPSAKFKVGDAVCYKGNKWHIVERDEFRGEIGYKVDNGTIFGWLFEREIRAWKETVLTQGMHSNGTWVTPIGGRYTIDPTWELTYLGEIIGHDTFLCKSKTNPTAKPSLFRGIKGDDIS